ncbi:MAG: hypothetical protein F6K42_00330 [Leptolyngbya sp. SIO1D8]|nr:hypothetical protein [Leptolyngbya sp. SIO1D8]
MTPALPVQVASYPRFSWLLLTRCIKRPLMLLVLSVGLLLGSLPFVATTATASNSEPQVTPGLADGIYSFGESPEAGQTGSTYMVLSVQSQQVVGAFYQPSSSFDCFYGQVTGNELTLTVVDSYDQTQYPYALALDASSQIASQDSGANALVPSGFYPLAELSDLDHSILSTCQSR